MSYELAFLVIAALKEWRKPDSNTQEQFKKKLVERLSHPHAPSAKLFGSADRYKIKLRSVGYRLVYEVRDDQMIVVEHARQLDCRGQGRRGKTLPSADRSVRNCACARPA